MFSHTESNAPRMTMRVYRVSPDGAVVTQELGRVVVVVKDKLEPLRSSQFPPCRCPRHRDRADL
ncbi:hypothetical protein [Streptomyces sp. PSAA01]|uniref:hypothetical protein n=1 Tax=Streptomyces sp. PSAA01 TaxID=2912762 RepID=UPI001F2CD195|nr:hypothetical protein [Streptomyces sp. PSAA01]MCG0285562.1 hypothetical protein [Streptomyces sp. PSAA01]